MKRFARESDGANFGKHQTKAESFINMFFLGPGARFLKVSFSSDIILFVSLKQRRLEARNFAVI